MNDERCLGDGRSGILGFLNFGFGGSFGRAKVFDSLFGAIP